MRGMLFSKKAEYACIAMLELAARHGDPNPIRLKAIADAHGIPERFLVQILLQLKGAGLVVSTRGASGGYQLAMPPEKIVLAQIVGVIDRMEPSPRKKPNAANSSPQTPLRVAILSVWDDIHRAQQQLLETTTLAELVQRAQSGYDFSYQI